MLNLISRILAVLYIAYVSVLALDVLNIGFDFFGAIVALLLHLIPALLVSACLFLAWKREVLGGAIFIVLGIIFTVWFKTYHRLDVFLTVSMPLFMIGTLFMIGGMSKPAKKAGA